MEDQSLNTLVEESSLKINNILFGDGDFGRARGLLTDIGYISFFEGGGLIGLFFLTLHFWIPALIYSKYKAYWEYRSLILILIALALFNLKDLAFYSHGIIQSYIIILFMLNEKQ